MREKNRKPIASYIKLPQFTTMNVIDGQAGVIIYSSLICYSLTIDNILNIIVLLILAGVTIVTLTGDNGLLQKATTAKEEQEEAKELELIKLAVSAAQVAGEGTITIDNLENELRLKFGDDKQVVEISDGWDFQLIKNYRIYKNGKVEEYCNKMWLFNSKKNEIGNWDVKPYRSDWAFAANKPRENFNYKIEDNNFKITGNYGYCSIVYLTDTIDISDWKNVYINITSISAVDGQLVFIKKDNLKDNYEFLTRIYPINKAKLYSADISNINEECYIGIYAGGLRFLNFDELYLTR